MRKVHKKETGLAFCLMWFICYRTHTRCSQIFTVFVLQKLPTAVQTSWPWKLLDELFAMYDASTVLLRRSSGGWCKLLCNVIGKLAKLCKLKIQVMSPSNSKWCEATLARQSIMSEIPNLLSFDLWHVELLLENFRGFGHVNL